MKKFKKVAVLALPVLLLFSMLSFWLMPKASAYVASSASEIQNATFEFKNRGLIIAKIGGRTVNFVDSKPFDKGIEFVAVDYECSAKINVPDDPFALWNLGGYPGSLDPKHIDISYNDGSGDGCKKANVLKAPAGVDVGMRTWFNWVDAGTLESVDGELVFKKTGNNDYFLLSSEAGKKCQDRIFIVKDTRRDLDNSVSVVETNSAKYFALSDDTGLSPKNTDASALPLGDGCGIVGFNFMPPGGIDFFNERYAKPFRIGEEQNKTKEAGSGVLSNGQTSAGGPGEVNQDACDLKGFTLNWIFCPMINAVDEIFDGINIFVESRLTINTNEFLTPQIKRTWDIFRVLATSLLVIIMLVMVISQAIGTGVFDAYTVRKVLPRLVVAAILIQLSWEMFIWVITLANHAGNGIYNLIAIPFGGREELGLNHLLGSLGNAAPGATIITAMLATGTVLIFNPFLVLLVAFMILMAVLTAAATLLFREILILACVILGPLALLAWILPGTNRYWKMWWENFSKALLIFPLIMGLLAIGRVFAWITANGGGTPGIFDWFAVLVGFFLPYYLLPKTFRWGGSLMSSAGSAINGAMKPLNSFGDRQLRDLGQLYQGKKANAYDATEPSKFGAEFGRKNLFGKFGGPAIRPSLALKGRAWKRLQSGHALPTERSRRLTIGKGDEWGNKRTDEAAAYARNVAENAKVNGFRDPETGEFVRDDDGNIIKGVAGMKLALNEIAGNSYDSDAKRRAARMAIKQMGQTSSWIEFQSARIRSGPNKGRRLVDLPNWTDELTKDPEEYSRTLGPRPDFAPDVIESAQQTVARRRNVTWDEVKANPKYQDEVDTERLRIATGRLKADGVPKLHFGYFQDIQRIADKETGFEPVLERERATAKAAGKKLRTEDEQRLRSEYLAQTGKSSDTATQLAVQLKQFRTEGGQLGHHAIAALLGQETQVKVDAALISSNPAAHAQSVAEINNSTEPAEGVSVPQGEHASDAPAAKAHAPSNEPQTSSGTEWGASLHPVAPAAADSQTGGVGPSAPVSVELSQEGYEKLGRTIGEHVGNAVGEVITPHIEAMRGPGQPTSAQPAASDRILTPDSRDYKNPSSSDLPK